MPAWKSPARFAFVLLALLPWFVSTALGQDFRVDTEIFVGEEKEPVMETLTVFTNGMVFDFVLTEPREVTVFDPLRGRITLLDESQRIKSGISTQEVLEFAMEFEAQAAESKNALFAFAARPEFITSTRDVEQNGQSLLEIKLIGKPLEYVVLGQKPQHPEAVRLYRQFADWYARLNATRAGNLPPAARLAVNEALAGQGLLPLEITRTIPPSSRFGKKIEIKSRHLVNWALGGEDRKKIDEAGTWMASFTAIGYDAYRDAARAHLEDKQASR